MPERWECVKRWKRQTGRLSQHSARWEMNSGASPTPCGEWDVGALVNHVLLGTRMSIQILDGMPRDEIIAGLNDDMLGASTDPVADFNRLAAQMCQGFAGPDGLEGMVVHPAGDFPRAMFAGFRVTDGAAHAWDLGHAMGAEPTLDAEMLEFLWADTEPKREMLAATGMFGDVDSGFTYARFVWARHCAAG